MLPGSFLRATRTADGPLVELHRPACTFPAHRVTPMVGDYDWGGGGPGAVNLAGLLLECAHERRPHPEDRDVFAELVVAELPKDGWTLSPAEIALMQERMEWKSKEGL